MSYFSELVTSDNELLFQFSNDNELFLKSNIQTLYFCKF